MLYCECGEPRHPSAESCERCAYLDGGEGRDGRIISAMRSFGGPASLSELAEEAGYHPDTVRRTLRELEGVGRVGKAYIDVAEDEGLEIALYWLIEGGR